MIDLPVALLVITHLAAFVAGRKTVIGAVKRRHKDGWWHDKWRHRDDRPLPRSWLAWVGLRPQRTSTWGLL